MGYTHRPIITISPSLIFHHRMDVRKHGLGTRDALLKLGNDGMGVCHTLLDIGNDDLGGHDTATDIRNRYICVYRELSLEPEHTTLSSSQTA